MFYHIFYDKSKWGVNEQMRKFVISLCLVFCCCMTNAVAVYAAEEELPDIIYQNIMRYNPDTEQAAWITQAILYAASQYEVDPLLITAIMENESAFSYQAVSHVGAIGLMQLLPSTAEMVGVDPYDPLENVLGGTIYLKKQLERFRSWGEYAVTDAVAAYNAGPEAVLSCQGVPAYAETREYVINVADTYQRLLEQIQQ